MRYISPLVTFVLLPRAASLDIIVTKPITCSSTLPITLNITYLGENNNNQLTFGHAVPVEGQFIFQGLSEAYPDLLDQNSTMSMDARLSFGYNAIALILEDSTESPICWENDQAECPGDGVYNFIGNYSLVLPPNDFLGWAATGFAGKIIVTFSVLGEKAGKCTMEVKTRRTGDYHGESRDIRNVNQLKLSGHDTFLIVLASIGGFVLLSYMVRELCRCCTRPMEQAADVVKEPLTSSPLPTKQPLITPLEKTEGGEMA